MKPALRAHGTKRLKLNSDIMLSNFAFKFNLRRYTVAAVPGCLAVADNAAASSARDHPARFFGLVGVGPSLP